MLEHALLEALFELSINDGLHFVVNKDVLLLLRGNKHALSRVDVYALMHERVDILAVLRDVKEFSSFKRQAKRFIVEVHEVEHLACNASRKLSLREVLVLNELFNAGDVFGDLVPLEVNDMVKLFKSVDLLLDNTAVEHRNKLG